MNGTEIDRYFRKLEAADAYSGVVLITQGDEALFEGAYGDANREWKIPNALDIRYDTASITKLFTAVAILQLIDQERLSFATRAVDYLGLEETSISPEANVYHLLTHTSGIRHFPDQNINVILLSNLADGVWEPIWRLHDAIADA
jgi:CubicO group peptidase (beta-lactamase class C family)